jgi:hypothetical protein
MTDATTGPAGKATLSAMLHQLALDDSRDRIAVSDLLTALGDRALAALLFVFAVPNVLPVPPGTSAILGPWCSWPRSWHWAADPGCLP